MSQVGAMLEDMENFSVSAVTTVGIGSTLHKAQRVFYLTICCPDDQYTWYSTSCVFWLARICCLNNSNVSEP